MLKGCAVLLFALSHHLGSSVPANDVHPMLGLECGSWSAGAYINSDVELYWTGERFTSRAANNVSAWAARRWTKGPAFIEAGIVLGYHEPVLPMVRAGVDLGYVEVFAGPGYDKYGNKPILVSGVQFKF